MANDVRGLPVGIPTTSSTTVLARIVLYGSAADAIAARVNRVNSPPGGSRGTLLRLVHVHSRSGLILAWVDSTMQRDPATRSSMIGELAHPGLRFG